MEARGRQVHHLGHQLCRRAELHGQRVLQPHDVGRHRRAGNADTPEAVAITSGSRPHGQHRVPRHLARRGAHPWPRGSLHGVDRAHAGPRRQRLRGAGLHGRYRAAPAGHRAGPGRGDAHQRAGLPGAQVRRRGLPVLRGLRHLARHLGLRSGRQRRCVAHPGVEPGGEGFPAEHPQPQAHHFLPRLPAAVHGAGYRPLVAAAAVAAAERGVHGDDFRRLRGLWPGGPCLPPARHRLGARAAVAEVRLRGGVCGPGCPAGAQREVARARCGASAGRWRSGAAVHESPTIEFPHSSQRPPPCS
eukprot:Opistho-1_new@23985